MSAAAVAPRKRRRRVNLARLNHILIPRRSAERDRYRRGLLGFFLRPFAYAHGALTREGRALTGIAVMVGVAGLDVGNSQVYLLWAALCGVLLGSLLARPLYGMSGARIRVMAPRRAIAFEPVHFDVELESKRALRAVRVETPFLPWDGRWLGRPAGIASVDTGGIGRTSVAGRFVERGEHHLDPFSARAIVPFGLAAGGAVRSSTCRFVVLPRVANVRDLELVHGGAGERRRLASSILGPTGDLAGVRPYRPGDPIRHLHARTWARTGTPHVREHVKERHERAGLVLLVDRRNDEKLVEAAISLAAGVASALARAMGGLGLVALAHEVQLAAPGAPAAAVTDDTMDRLAVHQPPALLEPERVLPAIMANLGDVSTIVVVTADRDEAPGEVGGEARAVIAALENAGLGVKVLLVVEEDAVPERGAEVTRVGRGVVESGVEIRL